MYCDYSYVYYTPSHLLIIQTKGRAPSCLGACTSFHTRDLALTPRRSVLHDGVHCRHVTVVAQLFAGALAGQYELAGRVARRHGVTRVERDLTRRHTGRQPEIVEQPAQVEPVGLFPPEDPDDPVLEWGAVAIQCLTATPLVEQERVLTSSSGQVDPELLGPENIPHGDDLTLDQVDGLLDRSVAKQMPDTGYCRDHSAGV